jgi:hypothetical protein
MKHVTGHTERQQGWTGWNIMSNPMMRMLAVVAAFSVSGLTIIQRASGLGTHDEEYVTNRPFSDYQN